jgi:Family of unknown function (DUF5994)
MTLTHAQSRADHLPTRPESRPRLRLKPKAPPTGYLDGAWWPRSDELALELPDLLAVLSVRLGAVDRVIYGLREWAKAPPKLASEGRSIKLDGYRRQPSNTIYVLGVNRSRIVLLVFPPNTEPDNARVAMMTAAAPGNTATVDALLTLDGTGRAVDSAKPQPHTGRAS